jgi:hypothetical protein
LKIKKVTNKIKLYMLETTMEVQELSLEKVIETKLVQGNVTDMVLNGLKERYGGLKLKAIDDKESYLELKAAKKDCAKVRNLAANLCKEGREDAIKIQKLWVAKEKEVVGRVCEVEDPIDAEIKRFDDEVKRKELEEKQRQEDAYIERQATLTRMGATYTGGCFVLGDASFEAELVKSSSPDVWEEAIVPKFQAEYEKVESARIAEEKARAEAQAEMERQRRELAAQQEEIRRQQEEMRLQREAQERADREKREAEEAEKRRIAQELQSKRLNLMLPYAAYGESMEMAALHQFSDTDFQEKLNSKRLAFEQYKIEKEETDRKKKEAEIEEAKQQALKDAEYKRLQAEAAKAEELAKATDKEKYADLISKINAIRIPEVKTAYFKKKVAAIEGKINEILEL